MILNNSINKNEPATMSVDELANFLKISRASAYKLCHKEDFPSMRLGKRILVLSSMLWEWLETQTEKPLKGKEREYGSKTITES